MAGTVITNKGLALMAKLLALEGELKFTRAAVGDGEVPSGIAPAVLTGLMHEVHEADIASCVYQGGDQSTITLQVSSVGLQQGFLVTEVGLFAQDPNEGEILYAYLSLQSDPQYIYATNSNLLKYAEFELNVVVGAMTSVTAVINPKSLINYDRIVHQVEGANSDQIPGMDLIQEIVDQILKNRTLLEAAGIGMDSIVELQADSSIKEIRKDGNYFIYSTTDLVTVKIEEFKESGELVEEKNVIGSTGLIPLFSLISQLNKKKEELEYVLQSNYYTKKEIDGSLNGKSNTGHLHDERYYTEGEVNNLLSGKAGTAVATQTTNGLESAADKKKLDGIKSGAEVNQNAFSKITSGNVTIAANAKEATLLLQAGSNVTITADNATKKVTIAATKDGGNAATLGGHAATYFAQANHNHDSRYYTETEVNNLLSGKAAATHTHSYLSLSGGTLTGNLKVNTTLNAVNFQENGVAGHLVYIGSTAPSNTNMVWID